ASGSADATLHEVKLIDSGRNVIYQPPEGFEGFFMFQYRLSNDAGTDTSQVYILVGDAKDDTPPAAIYAYPVSLDINPNVTTS
ncbi:MAG TPA: hypothetical protein DCE41_19175, partial [Cytophagales bacterium]|nr:hypothetical protein [Cytophagales bacterium]